MKSSQRPGVALEDDMERYLRQVVVPELLGCDPRRSAVFRQKAYYSAARGGDIVVDLAIELTLRGADSPFLIWIWECKDYATRVGVDDVEEFDSKLRQIGEHNTKGTIVSRNGFQKAALALAKTKGIGLVRLRDGEPYTVFHSQLGGNDTRSPVQKAVDALTEPNQGYYGVSALTPSGRVVATVGGLALPVARWLLDVVPRRVVSRCEMCGSYEGASPRNVLHYVRLHNQESPFPYFAEYALCSTCLVLLRGGRSQLVGCLAVLVALATFSVAVINATKWPWWTLVASTVLVALAVLLKWVLRWLVGGKLARRMRQHLQLSKRVVYPEAVPYLLLAQRFPALDVAHVDWDLAPAGRLPAEAVGGDYPPDIERNGLDVQ
jgi:hypothetical protein